jgi:serine/threonine-protein kinase RsbW
VTGTPHPPVAGVLGRFYRRVPATAADLVPVRGELGSWLRGLQPTLDEVRREDIVLASYEAMANAAEHAYAGHPHGDLTIEATYTVAALTVVVVDGGAWRAPTGEDPFRGRGLPLIAALTDRNVVRHGPDGTLVSMDWLGSGP